MTRERACEGCGGAGILPVYTTRGDTGALVPWTGRGRLSAAARREISHGARLSFTSRYEWALVRRCEPCLGTGRVVDSIPTADAVADAETLRLNTVNRLFAEGDYISTAERHARAALRNPDGGRYVREWRDISPSFRDWATLAARAAFRAVPGLRG